MYNKIIRAHSHCLCEIAVLPMQREDPLSQKRKRVELNDQRKGSSLDPNISKLCKINYCAVLGLERVGVAACGSCRVWGLRLVGVAACWGRGVLGH